MAATNKTLVFSAVVRGFNVYRDVWNPHENEELVCLSEANNLLGMFIIRTCRKNCEKTLVIYRERFTAQQNTSETVEPRQQQDFKYTL